MSKDPIVIVSFARTAIGNLLGELKTFSAPQLGSAAIKAAIERASLTTTDIDEVIMGCVLPAGTGQAPARQAALAAGLSNATPATTINKVCGSGMKAIMLAHDEIAMGSCSVAIAGGMESMTNAPYLLTKGREGYRLGNAQIYDHMMLDGLEDAYDKGKAMGVFAETCVKEFHFSRQEQDDFAMQSFSRAKEATEKGLFKAEITPLLVKTKQAELIIDKDEHPFSVKPEKIPQLSPVFDKAGTVTPGNASSIADGAAAVALMSLSEAQKRGLKPIAKIVGHSSYAKAPSEFTTAPIDATEKLLKKLNWHVSEVDLFEVNEAFAVVALAFINKLNIPLTKVNIHGGAVALGHPIGASGTRIVVTLLSALQQTKLKRGIATLCIGGGEATAIALEMME